MKLQQQQHDADLFAFALDMMLSHSRDATTGAFALAARGCFVTPMPMAAGRRGHAHASRAEMPRRSHLEKCTRE